MALFEYMKQCQAFIRDERSEQVNPENIIRYINRTRREIAMRAMCLRFLTPVSGSIVSATVTNQGNNYTAPTVVISSPDFPSGQAPNAAGLQATATATVVANKITAVNIVQQGAGYFQPVITITDPTGSGATAVSVLSYVNELVQGQEVYPFSSVVFPATSGLSAVHMIHSVSIIFSNYRYSLPMYAFSTYQALIRQYANTYQYVPFFGAQYGRGAAGSFYTFPLPSQTYQMEWDCLCLPIDLVTDQSIEAIEAPYTDCVPWLAASYCYNELQNWNAARYYEQEFDRYMQIYGQATLPGRVVNPYGRAYA